MQQNDYLGREKLSRLMLRFSVPCVLSLLVSALYNIVDQIFIGNSELSALGNAATGVVFPIFIVAQAFAWWIGDGCAAHLNICQGKNDTERVHKSIGTGIAFTLFVSLVLLALFFPLRTPLLNLFGATEPTMDMAVEYYNIVLAFFPVFMLMNMMSSVVRADGSPGWAMVSMLAGAVINIVLDAAFIFGFRWGMAGAAWATIIGQCVSLAITIVYFFRTRTFRLQLKSFLPDFKAFKPALTLGLSSFITQMTIVVVAVLGNAMLKKYGQNSVYGAEIPIALMGINSKVYTVVINLVVGVVLGCQPIISYNYGAGNKERVKKLYFAIMACTLAVGLFSTLVFECFPRGVAALFGEPTNVDPDAYWAFSEKVFRIYMMFVTFTCVVKVSSIFFQATGKPVRAVLASLVRDILCFVPLVCTLPLALGVEGCLWAGPLSDAVSIVVVTVLTIPFLRSLMQKEEA